MHTPSTLSDNDLVNIEHMSLVSKSFSMMAQQVNRKKKKKVHSPLLPLSHSVLCLLQVSFW